MKKLNIKNLFSLSWADYKKHWKIAILALIPVAILDLTNGMFGVQEEGEWVGTEWISSGMSSDPLSIVVSVVAFFAIMYVTVGLVKIYLNIVDGKEVDFMQNFNGVDSIKHFFLYLLTYIGVSLVAFLPGVAIMGITYLVGNSLGMNIGMALAIVGILLSAIIAIYLTVALQFSYYFSLENRYHFIDALKRSWNMTKGHRGKLFLLILAIILFNILGMFALLIGLLVTIPMTMLIYSHAYRQLDPEVNTVREVQDEEKIEVAIEE